MNNTSRNKWGLLIGVNEYPKLAKRYQLQGCVNDVELVQDTLCTKFGFVPDDITLLTDEKATRAGIISAMRDFASKVSENDIAVIHYSGHGSQRTDGPEQDESDGKDETIVPHDSGRGSDPNRDISDDEIHAWLLQLTAKTPYVTLIFDCCHSGTVSRDPFGAADRWLDEDTRPVAEFPEPAFPLQITKDVKKDSGAGGWLPLGGRYVLFAGCKDDESSYEVREGTLRHGALTYFLNQELNDAKPGTTYRDVFERASAGVTAKYPRQHPQLEGARDRELFGVQDIEPVRFVSVKRRKDRQVTLSAGAAHGMTVKSQWAIYPQGIKKIGEDTPVLGRVEITEVRAVTCDATILEEARANPITLDARAIEEAHFYGEMRLKVAIEAPDGYQESATKLVKLIRKSQLLRQPRQGEDADACVYMLAPRGEVKDGMPAPQIQKVNEPIWVAVGQDGKLMMPVHVVSEADALYDIRDNLEKVVRYEQTFKLRNPNEESPLKDKVEFVILCQSADDTWMEAKPPEKKNEQEDSFGPAVFDIGDRIAARITNHHDEPVYVSILDFGLTGAISLLHPIAGASEQLLPGRSIEIGVRVGNEIKLYMPDNFPYAPDPKDKESVGGMETLKLFVTSHEADFSWFEQVGMRGTDEQERMRATAKGFHSPLRQLFDMAYMGDGTREVRRNRVPPVEEWTTVERTFYLRSQK